MSDEGDRLVDTAAGPLNVRMRQSESAPVLAIHGVSSTNRLWLWLRDAAPWATLIEPDLAGRGLSPARDAEASTPAEHADHLVALLDALDVETVDVIGMSMGGFVGVELAAGHPSRVRSLTLVDGGLPVPEPPEGRPPLEAVAAHGRAAYGDTTDWPSLAAYVDRYTSTAGPLLDAADPRVSEMLAHDLAHGTDGGPVRRDLDTVLADLLEVSCTSRPAQVWTKVTTPMRLVHAEWSIGAGTSPMYPADHVASLLAATPPLVSAELVEGVDHAAIIMTPHGAARCAAALSANLTGGVS